MKKRLLSLCVCVVMLVCLTACGGTSAGDQEAVDAVKNSIQSGLDVSTADYSSYNEYKDNLTESVVVELDKLGDVDKDSIDDKELAKIVKKYNEALQKKSEGIQYIFTNSAKFNDLYYKNGKDIQIDCINSLVENYGLEIDEDYKDAFDSFMGAQKWKSFGLGEKVNLHTDFGKVAVAINGYAFVTNAGGEPEGDLLCEIENISYESEYNPGCVETETFIAVVDGNGNNILQSGEAYGDVVNGYPCNVGYIDLKTNQKVKIAITYQQTEETEMVKVILGDKDNFYECYVPVE